MTEVHESLLQSNDFVDLPQDQLNSSEHENQETADTAHATPLFISEANPLDVEPTSRLPFLRSY